MAAGMGSRFGGLKQIEPIDKNGNFIIDYSIYDAIRVGYDRVVFIIKRENYDVFRSTIGKRIEGKIRVDYVFQDVKDILCESSVNINREKPWGTGQDRKSTRLNSSHQIISYAVFCLKKKN